MKKTALILFILAVTVPAMGAVNITIENDANKVTIGYECTAAEEVRAFALTIDVNNSAFIVDSPESAVDANVADYYIYPGSILFTVEDGNTVIDEFGTPIAEQDANGGVLEMASLYSENDPDPNRWDSPADSNDLVIFDVNCIGLSSVTVTLSENSKRGGVVLKDPNEAFTLNLPAPLEVICEVDCLVVDQNCGGVLITPQMYANWVEIGKPVSWCHPAHFAGDINMDCKVTAIDVIGSGIPSDPTPYYSKSFGKVWPDPNYPPEGDNNNDKKITAIDIIGLSGETCYPPDCGIGPNFGRVFPDSALPPVCP